MYDALEVPISNPANFVAVLLLVGLYTYFVRRPLRVVEASLLTALVAVPLIAFSAQSLKDYRLVLFLLTPFLIGFVSVLLFCRHVPDRTYRQSLYVAGLSTLLTALGLLVFAVDGFLCVAMAAPLAIVPGIGGSYAAWAIVRRFRSRRVATAMMMLLLLATPVLMGAEAARPPEPPVFEVRTSLVVSAPPEVVWRHVVAFPEIGPPAEWLFRAGVAYPLRTEIDGSGAGASRRCVLSTGVMPETVEVWDEPRLLRFSVQRTPPSMRELSPWRNLHPAHLEGSFRTLRGQFRLVPLPGGRTRVEGTSWYQQDFYPAAYWRLWSDAVVHRVHRRVLEHVRRLSEGEAVRN